MLATRGDPRDSGVERDGASSPGKVGLKDAKVWSSRGVEEQGAWRGKRAKRKESKSGQGGRKRHVWSPGAPCLKLRTLLGRSGRWRGEGILGPTCGSLWTH